MRTIIAKEPDKRIVEIFKSNVNIMFTFVPIFKYIVLPLPSKWLADLKSGYFNWLIFTSFRSWQILMGQIAEKIICIPDQTKIAVFGSASVGQIKQSGGRVDFTAHAHDASEFGLMFINQLHSKQKIAYPASCASSTQIEECLSTKDIRVCRKNIYKPRCIIDPRKINEIIFNFNPDSMVFFSSKTVKSFMDYCSVDILKQIERMQLFALGNHTSKTLGKYSIKKVIKSNYPDIYILSDLIHKVSQT